MSTCILLAGGLGTRLRAAVPDVPKCLAPVAGSPFLKLQMTHLAAQGVERFILSLGDRADRVIEVAQRLGESFAVDWVVEPRPLGTGGATLFAMDRAALDEALVANADTILQGDLSALLSPLDPHAEHLRVLAMRHGNAARFGALVVNAGKAGRFLPRGAPCAGLVSAGMYRVHRRAFARYRPGEAFSLEADVMEESAKHGKLAAAVVPGEFVDIGVPGDYFRFCAEVAASERWRQLRENCGG